jgi:hypothetical protein
MVEGSDSSNPSWSWAWLAKARNDDWWHCRQLLRLIASCAFHLDEHRRFEEGKLMLLAAIEGGSTEALFMADPLEGLLRDISQSELRREPQGAGGHTDVEERLRELATFVHGAASRNLMLRTPY